MIAGLLLASGASRRFGSNKLLAPLGGRPVVRWSAEALAGAVDETWVVVPAHDVEIRTALGGLPLRFVENLEATEGMASSIRAGVAALPTDADAVTIALGDQPLIALEVIRRVVAAWRRAPVGHGAVVARYEDGRGHPVLFGASQFPTLCGLEGDNGARALLASLGDAVAVVEVAGSQPADVDTPEALAELARRLGRTR